MPGGYGTSGPWGSAGETYSQPEPSWQQGGPGHPGGYNPNLNPPVTVDSTPPIIDTSWYNPNDPQTQSDIDALEAKTHPYGGLMLAEELAGIAATDPKYEDSWDWKQGYDPNTLGKFIATDWEGNPILDSSGNVIWSGLGEYAQENYGDIRPAISGTSALENLQGIEKEYFRGRTEQEQSENRQRSPYDRYGDPGGGGGSGGDPGGWLDVKLFSRGRPENIHPYWQNVAGTPMLPVAGSGAGASMASADELYALASGKKAFSSTPEEQGILALLNA